jgi:hypothetical protein
MRRGKMGREAARVPERRPAAAHGAHRGVSDVWYSAMTWPNGWHELDATAGRRRGSSCVRFWPDGSRVKFPILKMDEHCAFCTHNDGPRARTGAAADNTGP